MDSQAVADTLIDTLIITANGALAILYWLVDHLFAVLAWPIAGAVMLFLDRPAHARPKRRRDGRSIQKTSLAPYLSTLLLAIAWSFVALAIPTPIPQIGLAMWMITLVLPLSDPEERDTDLIATLRWFLWIYTVICIAFFLLLKAQLSPRAAIAWAQLLAQPGGGEAMEASVLSSAVPWATMILWVVYPMAFGFYVAERIKMHRRSRRNPLATIRQRISQLRTRTRKDG
jgi:hypothetical protein